MSEPLSTDNLARLALLSSGLNEQQSDPYIEKLAVLLKKSESVITPGMDTDQKAEALLVYLHDTVFKRYSLTQTTVHTVLDRGTYNCVSSAMVYMIITRYHNIPVEGVHAEDHAFCRVIGTPQGGTDVETTNEWGYNPGLRKEFQSSFTDRTGYVYVPPGNYSERQRLGDRDMAGLILQNRIVELQNKNRHMDALTLAADRLALTGSVQARLDYFNTVQNAAAQKNNRKEYLQGIDIINQAALGDSDFPDFLRETRAQLVFNACAESVNNNDLSAARGLLESQGLYLSADEKRNIRILISRRELEVKVRGAFSPAVIQEIAEAAASGDITRDRAATLGAYHYSIESERLSREGRNIESYLFMLEAESWIQKDREYKRLIPVLRDNAAIEYHNQIVRLMQQDKRDEARAVLSQGLELIPRSSLLLQDKRKLEQ
ncbi:MAG: hypothetical protein PQJ58_12615 [Spirochaetales bacterium]|nr:hypothetical protein [Spirochaetales bacterium]